MAGCFYYRPYTSHDMVLPKPKPYPCPCQSCADSRNSDDVTKQHVTGKLCKKKNQCRHCCYIKHIYRKLKHCGGTCSSKKCPICDRQKHTHHNMEPNQRQVFRMIREMYGLMLGFKLKF